MAWSAAEAVDGKVGLSASAATPLTRAKGRMRERLLDPIPRKGGPLSALMSLSRYEGRLARLEKVPDLVASYDRACDGPNRRAPNPSRKAAHRRAAPRRPRRTKGGPLSPLLPLFRRGRLRQIDEIADFGGALSPFVPLLGVSAFSRDDRNSDDLAAERQVGRAVEPAVGRAVAPLGAAIGSIPHRSADRGLGDLPTYLRHPGVTA